MHGFSYKLILPILAVLLSLSGLTANQPALAAADGMLSCEGGDPSKYDIYGCCPKEPMAPISTKCEPLIGRYSDSLFVPVGHPDKKEVPYSCHRSADGRFNIGTGTANDAACRQRELGDDDVDSGDKNSRMNACEKIFEKGTSACLWRLEDGMCSGGSALAAAGNPGTVGRPKMPNATADVICESLPRMVSHSASPYTDHGAAGIVQRQQQVPPTLLSRLLGSTAAHAAINIPGIGNLSGMFQPPQEIQTAGGLLQQVARQFQPSLGSGGIAEIVNSLGGFGGMSGGAGAAKDPIKFLLSMMESTYGAGGFQLASAGKRDIAGKLIGPTLFKVIEGFSASHVYDRDQNSGWREFAVMKTEPYGTYDPSQFQPGQELRMALDLAKMTPTELAEAKRIKNPLVKNAYASVGASGNLMEKALPYSHQYGSNDKVLRYLTGTEMSLSSFRMGQRSGFNLKDVFERPVAQQIDPNADIRDFKQTRYAQIFDPSNIFSPRDKLNMFPERDHYSPCMNKGSCKVTEDYKTYSIGSPYHSSGTDAYRCSGTRQKLIRTDVLRPRYREFNAHALMRITYNRMCRANIAPKPCHRLIPCWSRLCWGVGISEENPPCATRHENSHDIGYPFFCYHPRVKMALKAQLGGSVDTSVAPKRYNDVCHDLAKPIPMINKLHIADIKEMVGKGMTVPESASFRQLYGNSRPYIALDTTGYELGQNNPGRPDYYSDKGADIVAVASANLQAYTKTAALPSLPSFGFNDKQIGFVKNVLAAAGGTPTGGGSGCCFGGLGGATGDGCGQNGIDPFASSIETLVSQRRTAQWYGLNCLPKFETAFNPLSAEGGMVTQMTGATVQRRVDGKAAVGTDSSAPNEQNKLRSMVISNACRGYMTTPDKDRQFPFDGGCRKPNITTGLNSIVDLGERAGGAIIMLPTGGAISGEKPGLPNLAVVLRAGTDDAGKYIDAVMTNTGIGPDRCGITQDVGTRRVRRFRDTKLSDAGQREYDRAKAGGPATISQSCLWEWSECRVDFQSKWFHPGDESNLCQDTSSLTTDNPTMLAGKSQ